MANPKLLVGACGSVGVVLLPQYLIALRRRLESATIRVLMTRSAQNFVPASTIDLFCPTVDVDSPTASHIRLGGWPDLFVVLPATADVLARAALGLADTVMALTILAHPKPILFLPNMNQVMWHNPRTQSNVAVLRQSGHLVVDPEERMSYCVSEGDTSQGGAMADPDEVARIIGEALEARHR